MKVAFVTMQFPVSSETFQSNDVRSFTERGLVVEAYGLRPAHRRAEAIARERELEDVRRSHNGLLPSLRGVAFGAAHPLLALQAVGWLLRSAWHQPSQLVRSVVLLPRAFDILRELNLFRPDIVHLAWGHYPATVGFLVQRALPHTPTSISLAAYDLTQEFGGTVSVARRANVVRTLAHYNVPHVSQFLGIPEERIEVIYDGVDLARLDDLIREVDRIPHRIAVASRLIVSKRIDDAIRSFAEVRRERLDATLVIMGDGPERESLEALARNLGVEEAVRFLGHVPHEQVIREFAKSEVVLMPSVKSSERLPNAVKEGMACGCICVASRTPGMAELISDGETGFIYEAGNAGEAARAMLEIFSGKVDSEAMSARARQAIEKDFDLSRTAQSYIDLWRKLVEGKGPTVQGRVMPRAEAAGWKFT